MDCSVRGSLLTSLVALDDETHVHHALQNLLINVYIYFRYFIPLKLFLCFYLPTAIPVYCWGETWFWAFISQALVRYVFGLNFTWSVNSVAHLWGYRPYDK